MHGFFYTKNQNLKEQSKIQIIGNKETFAKVKATKRWRERERGEKAEKELYVTYMYYLSMKNAVIMYSKYALIKK